MPTLTDAEKPSEWKEFLAVNKQHFSLLLNDKDAQDFAPSPAFLTTLNPISRVHAYNAALKFEQQQQSSSILSNAAQKASTSVDAYSVFTAGVMLGYHGSKVCLIRACMKLKSELIFSCASMAGGLVPSSKISEIYKDLVKTWKTESYYESIGYLEFLFQFFSSQLFKSESAQPITKAFWSDFDTILKHLIVSFETHGTADGVGKTAAANLLAYLVRYAAEKSQNADQALKKRLSRITASSSTSSALALDPLNTQLLNTLMPATVSIPVFLYPFSVLSSYLFKYRFRKNIILGVIETFHVMLIQLGTAFVQSNLLTFIRFFGDMATNPKYDSIENGNSGSYPGEWMETSLTRRELIIHLLQITVLRDLIGRNPNLIQQVFGFGIFEPFVKQLSSVPDPTTTILVGPHNANVLLFYLEIFGTALAELGPIGTLLPSPQTNQNVVDIMVSFWSLFCQVDSNIELGVPCFEFPCQLAFVLKTLMQANPNNNSGILSKMILLLNSQLEKFENLEASEESAYMKLIYTAKTLFAIISVVPYCTLNVSESWFHNLANLAGKFINLSARTLDSLNSRSQPVEAISLPLFWKKSAAFSWVGWNLISALTCLDASFVKSHLPQWLLIWKTFLVKITAGEKSQSISPDYGMWIVITREASLTAIWSLLRNHPEVTNADLTKRLLSCVTNTIITLNSISSNLPKLLDASQKYRPPRFAHFCHSLQNNSSPPTTAASALSSIGQFATAALFTKEYPNSSACPPAILMLFKISLYDRPVLHFQLLQKRLYQVLTLSSSHAFLHPKLYEVHHISLLRELLDFISTDYLSGNVSSDLGKVIASHEVADESQREFPFDSDEYVKISSSLRYGKMNLQTTSFFSPDEKSSSIRKGSLSSHLLLKNNNSQAITNSKANLLKSFEGVGPADLFDTDRQIQWISANIENDPCLLWTSVNPVLISSSPFTEKMDEKSNDVLNLIPRKMYLPRPLIASVSLVDLSINLFGILFIAQNASYQYVLLDQILKTFKLLQQHSGLVQGSSASPEVKDRLSKKLNRIQVNSLAALISVFAWHQKASKVTFAQSETLQLVLDSRLIPLLQEICIFSWSSSYTPVRALAADLLGRTAKVLSGLPAATENGVTVGPKYPHEIIKISLDTISASSRDPNLRAGAVLGLGWLFHSMGTLSLHISQIRTILNVMTTLIMDSHITVHTWALNSFWMMLDACGVNWMTSLGAKEFGNIVMSVCFSVLTSDNHAAFIANASNDIKTAALGISPAGICPYRITLRIMQTLLGIIGPELAMPTGQPMTDGVLSLLNALQLELVALYRLLNPPPSPGSTIDAVTSASLTVQMQLKLVPFPFNITSDESSSWIVPIQALTFITPLHYLLTDSVSCIQQLITFNAHRNVGGYICTQFQAFLLPHSAAFTPMALKRAVSKFLWQVTFAYDMFEKERNIYVLDHLIYALDYAILNEQIPNGGGRAGTLEDDILCLGSGDEPLVSSSLVEVQLVDILYKWFQSDMENRVANRWVSLSERIINRNNVISRASDVLESPTKGLISSPDATDANNDNQKDDDAAADEAQDETAIEDDDGKKIEAVEDEESTAKGAASSKVQVAAGIQSASAPNSPLKVSSTSSSSAFSLLSDKVRAAVIMAPLPSNFAVLLALDIVTLSLCVLCANPNNVSLWDVQSARKKLASLSKDVSKQPLLENESKGEDDYPIILKLNELIRLAFTSATDSNFPEFIRVNGLHLLSTVLESFGPLRDPEFPEYSLLEQYQAQISAGLSLAFTSGSTAIDQGNELNVYPALQAISCAVSANYVVSGICPDISALSRVLKILNGYVDLVKSEKNLSIAAISPVSETIVQTSIISAWAKIYAASKSGQNFPKYLGSIASSQVQHLVPLWLAAIEEFVKSKNLSPGDLQLSHSQPRRRSNEYLGMSGAKAIFVFQLASSWNEILLSCGSALEEYSTLLVQETKRGSSISTLMFPMLSESCEILFDALSWSLPNERQNQKLVTAFKVLHDLFNPVIMNHSVWMSNDVFGEVVQILGQLFHKFHNQGDQPMQANCVKVVEKAVKSFGPKLYEGDDLTKLHAVVGFLLELHRLSLSKDPVIVGQCVELLAAVFLLAPNISVAKLPLSALLYSLSQVFLVAETLNALQQKFLQYAVIIFSHVQKLAVDDISIANLVDGWIQSSLETLQLCSSLESYNTILLFLIICITKSSQCRSSRKEFISVLLQRLNNEFTLPILATEFCQSTGRTCIQSIRVICAQYPEWTIFVVQQMLMASSDVKTQFSKATLAQKPFLIDYLSLSLQLCSSIADEKKKAVSLLLLFPALTFWMDADENGLSKDIISSSLIRLAGSNGAVFKQMMDVLEAIAPAIKEKLENSVREVLAIQRQAVSGGGLARDQSHSTETSAKAPTIELKMDFGSFV